MPNVNVIVQNNEAIAIYISDDIARLLEYGIIIGKLRNGDAYLSYIYVATVTYVRRLSSWLYSYVLTVSYIAD